jgi:uncharacterized metal-binding protein
LETKTQEIKEFCRFIQLLFIHILFLISDWDQNTIFFKTTTTYDEVQFVETNYRGVDKILFSGIKFEKQSMGLVKKKVK